MRCRKIDTKKRNITILAVLGVVVIAVLCTIMFILPGFESNKKAKAGETIVVTVYAPRVEDMYAYEFKVRFNQEDAEYIGELKSSIDSISMIFAKQIDPHVLVGATMIGEVPTYTADQPEICTLSFKALKDFNLSDLVLEDVNIVKGDSQYVEGIEDWTMTTTITK